MQRHAGYEIGGGTAKRPLIGSDTGPSLACRLVTALARQGGGPAWLGDGCGVCGLLRVQEGPCEGPA